MLLIVFLFRETEQKMIDNLYSLNFALVKRLKVKS